jgi:hypothetical protein
MESLLQNVEQTGHFRQRLFTEALLWKGFIRFSVGVLVI